MRLHDAQSSESYQQDESQAPGGAGLFHQTQPQMSASKGTTPGRQMMQQTRLISSTPVVFVWGKGGRGDKHSGASGCFLVCYFCARQTHGEGPFCQPWDCSPCLFCWGWAPPKHPPSRCPLQGKRLEMQQEETHIDVRVSCNTTEVAFQLK